MERVVELGVLNPCEASSEAVAKSVRTKKLGDPNRHYRNDRKRRERASHYEENEKNNVTITLL